MYQTNDMGFIQKSQLLINAIIINTSKECKEYRHTVSMEYCNKSLYLFYGYSYIIESYNDIE